ncbi:hypothetical protein NDR87_34865 [Nocardia sp. CDC159]|uniref:Uncharacterized protein n=1 Tax=Nocardia pulmonis TaxID=2951408 RepID=A0A9X2J0L0_9NOCA|nr:MULTISPECIES: hypothetical protein [Nocardia]MCM6778673.1 hypothetical protein [Nocardia pulmonis]MCM6791562.1 hypothetical protein [Nocardia sp. CDC159]
MTTTPDAGPIVSDSLLFGNVLVTRSDDRISARLESDDSTVVTIERLGPRTRKSVSIGTRDPRKLRASVNDRPLTITPGSGRLPKRTYRVLAEVDDRIVSLRPKDMYTCEFIDGRPHEIERRFAELRARADGSIEFDWATTVDLKALGVTVGPPEPTAEDVLIGCALATAFGTGSLSLVEVLLNLAGALLP